GRLCCRTTDGQPERLLARFYGHRTEEFSIGKRQAVELHSASLLPVPALLTADLVDDEHQEPQRVQQRLEDRDQHTSQHRCRTLSLCELARRPTGNSE